MTATQLFLDSVIMEEIRDFSWLISGVTTTPTFFAREHIDYHGFIKDFVELFPMLELHIEALGGSAKETAQAIENIISEPWFNKEKIVLKIPMSAENMRLVRKFSKDGIRFNTHLVFTPEQAFLAAQAGTDYICPLLGRFAESTKNQPGRAGTDLNQAQIMVEAIVEVIDKTGLRPPVRVMASSLRDRYILLAALQSGVDAITVPTHVLLEAFDHPLTTQGVEKFLKDMNIQNER